jgi:hypothetical protein
MFLSVGIVDELLKAMQSQIDDQMAKFATTGPPVCQNSLILDVEGNPDMHCFVDASFARSHKRQPKDQPTETTLQTILGWLGFRNFFMPSHVPPKISLAFTRKCQFPTPPYLYGTPSDIPIREGNSFNHRGFRRSDLADGAGLRVDAKQVHVGFLICREVDATGPPRHRGRNFIKFHSQIVYISGTGQQWTGRSRQRANS